MEDLLHSWTNGATLIYNYQRIKPYYLYSHMMLHLEDKKHYENNENIIIYFFIII